VLDLLGLFQRSVAHLERANAGAFRAVPIPGLPSHRLAKDRDGAPCILIRQIDGSPAPSTLLENMSITYNVVCNVDVPGRDSEVEAFTVIRCSPDDENLYPHFLRVMSPILMALGDLPRIAVIRDAMARSVELFRSLVTPGLKAIQGLWGELFLIKKAQDVRASTLAWHNNPYERVDFSMGDQRLELKSSGNRGRTHHFSLAQLQPPNGTILVVASVFVERASGGTKLFALQSDIRDRLSGDVTAIERFDRIFYASLGANWKNAVDDSFDEELAEESFALFNAFDVPSVSGVPGSVSEVRFRSNLSNVTQVSRTHLRSLGGLFAALL